MKTTQRFLCLILISLLFCNVPSFAWDSVGHMAVAYVAYQQLTPAAKAKVKTLLKMNPDYKNGKWQKLIPAGTSAADQDMFLFMIAATWPDQIKGETGYITDGAPGSNGNRPDGPDSSRNIGYTDKFQHRYWHFVDTPFSIDNTAVPAIPTPNAETQIVAFRAVIASKAKKSLKSYDLVWLEHLIGDVHQPLHSSTRVSAADPQGDAGGNNVKLTCSVECNGANELHALWDNALGAGTDPSVALAAAKALPAPDPTAAANTDTATWIKESFDDAESDVYKSPVGPTDGPFDITQAYEDNAKAVSSQRIALAGARLAKVINSELK